MASLVVNGESVSVDLDSVAALVLHYGFESGQVVVEVNGAVVSGDSTLGLVDGDVVEIVRFIGGGA